MVKQVIANGTTANDGTGDTLRSAATKINSNFSEVYTILGGDSTALTSKITFGDGTIIFEGTTADANETTIIADDPGADRQIVFPNASGHVLLDSSTATLTNKTLTSPVLTTPQINDTSANHQYVVGVSELAADRTITLPLLTGDDEVTFNAHTQTLTNKSLTTPTLNASTVTGLSGAGVFNDSAGNEALVLTKTTSAVNHIGIKNSATTNGPIVEALGTDTNIDVQLTAKGTGGVKLNSPQVLTQETKSTAGAISNTVPFTEFTSGSAKANSLADGASVGQMKTLVVSGAGTVTLTPANFGPGTTLTLEQNESAVLIWEGTNWQILSTYGGAVA